MAKKLPGYELTFITRVDLSDDALKLLKDRVNAIIKAYDGEVVYEEDWGKRKFAYPIEKELRGHYTHVAFSAKGDVVAEIERNLRIHESILRFMTISLAKEFDKEVYTKELGAGTPLKREDRAIPTVTEMGAPGSAPAAATVSTTF